MEKEAINLFRLDDRIVVCYEHGHQKDKQDRVEYTIGEMPKEDIESSYIGALKYFFDNSEVWNNE